MADLLLELLCEEIPARMQSAAIEQLERGIVEGCKEAQLHYTSVQRYVTPRRLAVLLQGLPEKQPDQTIERKGPKTNAPDKAIEGFCASVGLRREELEIRVIGKDDVYFAVNEQAGKPTAEALTPIIEQVLAHFHWPKSMRWGNFEPHWVRPLRNILCILDETIVPVTWGHLTTTNQTVGHRFMAPESITVSRPSAYESLMEKAYVIASAAKRKALIAEATTALAAQQQLTVKEDAGLLEEVTGLVEYPVPLIGQFDASYLRLPPEVLVLEMRHHQKYFAALQTSGQVSNVFLTVANITAKDGGKHIIAGNQRVLRARLDDGAFYWEQDRKKPLSDWAKGLSGMIFHKKLGSMAEKVARMEPLAEYLCIFVPHASVHHVERAVKLCKADLTSGMVGEFPELQGIMGRYYALEQGEPTAVADAIRDHYKPAGAHDDLPATPEAIALSLADKLDSLVGLFAAGEAPTGSKDPYALRRMALGILRIIREHQLRLPLRHVLDKAYAAFSGITSGKEEVVQTVFSFMMERLKVALKDESIRYDVVDAVLADSHADDITSIVARAQALQGLLSTDDGENLLAAYKRSANILKKEEQKDNDVYKGDFSASLFVTAEEQHLADALKQARSHAKDALKEEDYTKAMMALGTLRQPLDAFFDKVIVNADDAAIRRNRLELLANLREVIHHIADFSQLEG